MAKEKTIASIADNALIISITGDGQAKVWRKEMTSLSSASFELADADRGVSLVARTADGMTESIYIFKSKAAAIAGLNVVTEALLNGPGFAPAVSSGSGVRRMIKYSVYVVLGVIVLVALMAVFATPGPKQVVGTDAISSSAKTGVPVPAEDVFK